MFELPPLSDDQHRSFPTTRRGHNHLLSLVISDYLKKRIMSDASLTY